MSIEQNLDLNELMQVRMDKLKELKEKGINPLDKNLTPPIVQRILDQSEELIASGQEVIIAGRMMAKRATVKQVLLTCRI